MAPFNALMVLLLALLGVSPAVSAREVSHEDLRKAVLSLAQLSKETADKLQGHDLRERQVAEHLKRVLMGIDRRLNSVEEPLKRMDERVKKLEEVMTQVDQRSKVMSDQQTAQTSSLAGVLATLREMAFRPETAGPDPGLTVVPVVPVGQALAMDVKDRVDQVLAAVDRLERRLEQRSAHDQSRGPQSDLLDNIGKGTEAVRQAVAALTAELGHGRLERLHNESLSAVQAVAGVANEGLQVGHGLRSELDELKGAMRASADEVRGAITETRDELEASMSAVAANTEVLTGDVARSYETLRKDVSGLAGVERVLIQTGDNVLDAKRRVEYGVHQILQEVGALVKKQSGDLNETLNQRFDAISHDILSHQTENLGNLSSKIETEIAQVWRQIGIMYEQLTASASMLDRLQQQTEIYVNGSLQTMDGMEGKVGQITGRMGEVDENLNYLLGRLSLVTQEFNQIKSGLAGALDSIRRSFLELQGQVKDIGPGPNPIPEEPSSSGLAIQPNRGDVDNHL